MNSKRRVSALLSAAVASVLSLQMASAVGVAPGDSFTPLPDPPSQEVLNVPSVMQPAYPNSTATYTVSVAVGSQGSVSSLSRIDMCWFKASDLTGCGYDSNGNVDPRNQFTMSWYNNHSGEGDSPSNADNWFYISDAYYQGSFWTPEYENSGSTSGYGDGTGASMNISFKFRISHGMLAGNDWSVRVTAVDFNGQETPQTATGVTVLYFGSVVAQRESVDFGSLTGGEDGIVNDLWDGAMTANASSDLTYKATSFSYLTNELALATGLPSAAPSAGKVAFDCNPSTTWDEGTALRLAATPKTARTGLYAGGTGEMGGDDLRHSCRVWFGGSAPVANQYYNSTFTVGIGAGGI